MDFLLGIMRSAHERRFAAIRDYLTKRIWRTLGGGSRARSGCKAGRFDKIKADLDESRRDLELAQKSLMSIAGVHYREAWAKLHGAKGGDTANLTGYDKALHLAKVGRQREPGISDRDLANWIKVEGGSRVTVGPEALRKKIADWVAEGQIPMSTATAGRKPKRGKKRGIG